MHKRRLSLTHDNSDTNRWIISYADFITLLFAFFVIMYAISSVNISKYHIISNSLEDAFHNDKTIDIKDKIHYALSNDILINNDSVNDKIISLNQIYNDILNNLDLILDNDFILRRFNDSIELEIKSNVLFIAGSAELNQDSEKLLSKLVQLFGQFSNAIDIEGFTDDLPINNIFYPSNWELSASRASAVVRYLVAHGIAPDRLVAKGYGKFHPVSDNRTVLGRNQNRRVVFVISDKLHSRENKMLWAEEKTNNIISFDGPVKPSDLQTKIINKHKSIPKLKRQNSVIFIPNDNGGYEVAIDEINQ